MPSPTTRRKRDPKLCHHKATGQGYVRINGRCHYLGRYDDPATRQAYRLLINQVEANGGELPPPPEESTVTEICLAYLRWWQAEYRDRRTGKVSANVAHIKQAMKILRSLYGSQPAASFEAKHLYAVQAAIRKTGIGRVTINERVAIVRRIFKWAGKRGMVPTETARRLADVDPVSSRAADVAQPRKVKPVAQASVDAVLPHLSPVLAAMVEMQLLTAMRPVECCDMRPIDIDRDGRVWVYQPPHHKTKHHGKDRVILIGPKAQQVLSTFMGGRDPERHIFTPAESVAWYRHRRSLNRRTLKSCGNRIGTNRKARPTKSPGERWTSNSYRQSVHRACDAAGVERWSPNQLRHAAATNIRKEFGLEVASLVLGHSSAVLADQVYAQRDVERLKSIMAQAG